MSERLMNDFNLILRERYRRRDTAITSHYFHWSLIANDLHVNNSTYVYKIQETINCYV